MTKYYANLNHYRTLGIEVECIVSDSYDLEREMRGNGLEAHAEGYNHRTRDYWKIITDSSLGSSRRGGRPVEVVSPVLEPRGDGWEQLKLALRSIRATDGYVNRSCGLHVHWGARDMTGIQIRSLLSLYTKFEPVIDSLVSPSRRTNNTYCGMLDPNPGDSGEMFWIRDLDSTGRRNGSQIADSFSYRYGRFRKINLESLDRYGTVEFRQHQGTLSFSKTKQWALLMNLLMTKAHYRVNNTKPAKQSLGEFIRALRIADHHLENPMYSSTEARELRRLREWMKRRESHFNMGLDRELTEDENGVSHDERRAGSTFWRDEEEEEEEEDVFEEESDYQNEF